MRDEIEADKSKMTPRLFEWIVVVFLQFPRLRTTPSFVGSVGAVGDKVALRVEFSDALPAVAGEGAVGTPGCRDTAVGQRQ